MARAVVKEGWGAGSDGVRWEEEMVRVREGD
jgi:hypothetical protein